MVRRLKKFTSGLGVMEKSRYKLFTLVLFQLVLNMVVYRLSVDEFFPSGEQPYLVIVSISWEDYIPLYTSFVLMVAYLIFFKKGWSKFLYMGSIVVSFGQVYTVVNGSMVLIWLINLLSLICMRKGVFQLKV